MTSDRRVSRLYGTGQTVVICLFALASFFGPGPMLFDRARISIVSDVLDVLGICLIVIAVVTLRRAVQIDPEPKAEAALVTTGVYSRLRHPIYTAILACTLGLTLSKPTTIDVVAMLGVWAFLLSKARFEERLLLAHYPEYGAYRARTWGVLPGIG